MRTRRLFLALAAFPTISSVTGCLATSPVQHATPSGRPEVVIPRRSAKAILADISNEMVNIAFEPRTRSEMSAVFEKYLERTEQLLLGAGGKRPVRRVTFDIIESEASTRVLATLSIVSDPGGRDELATPVNDSKESLQLQALLDRVKAKNDRR